MRRTSIIIAAIVLSITHIAPAQNRPQQIEDDAYTVIANPGETATHRVRINWHTNLNSGKSYCVYTKCSDIDWEQARKTKARQEVCTAYDSLFSKKASGEDFYENVRFLRNTVELKTLKQAQSICINAAPIRRQKSTTSKQLQLQENGVRLSFPTFMHTHLFLSELNQQ